MAAVTIIKLTGQNHRDIDNVAGQIKTICDNGGISLRGPIPLQPDTLLCQFVSHQMEKALKPTTTGNYVSTSVCLKWTSHLEKVNLLYDRLLEFLFQTQ